MTLGNTSQNGSLQAAGKKEINIQNQFLNFIRKEKAQINVFLVSGKKFLGQVVGFDRYTVHLRCRDFDQIIFKHAIANISIPRQLIQKMSGMSDGREVFPSADSDEGDSETE